MELWVFPSIFKNNDAAVSESSLADSYHGVMSSILIGGSITNFDIK